MTHSAPNIVNQVSWNNGTKKKRESAKVEPPDRQRVTLQCVGCRRRESEMMSARPATNRERPGLCLVTICWCWKWGLVGGSVLEPLLRQQQRRPGISIIRTFLSWSSWFVRSAGRLWQIYTPKDLAVLKDPYYTGYQIFTSCVGLRQNSQAWW